VGGASAFPLRIDHVHWQCSPSRVIDKAHHSSDSLECRGGKSSFHAIKVFLLLIITCCSTSSVRPNIPAQRTNGSWFPVVLAATTFVYDFLLTFATEVEQIWKAHWTPLKVVYLLQRYSPFIDTVFLSVYCECTPVQIVSAA
jgi:hypothetical protein